MLITAGCGGPQTPVDKTLSLWALDPDVIDNRTRIADAREIRYRISVGTVAEAPCDNADYCIFMAENTNPAGDKLMDEFIRAYNERNGTDFNVLMDYDLRYRGRLDNNVVSLTGTLSGLLLEVK